MELRLVLIVLAVFLILLVTLLISFSPKVRFPIKAAFWFIFLGLASWQVNIYIADTQDVNLLLANNLVFLWPALAIYATAWVVYLLDSQSQVKSSNHTALNSPFIITASLLFITQLALALSNKIFSDVSQDAAGEVIFTRSDFYLMYIFTVAASIAVILYKLYEIYRSHSKGTKQHKAIKIVAYTIFITIGYSVLTNVLIPLISASQNLISLGVFSSVIFAAGLALSITKYSFLDIKLVVARSVAYLLSLGLLVSGFALFSSLLSRYVLDESTGENILMAANTIAFILAILAYPVVKKFFDRVTNRIFYRDAYDPQIFLDQLNKTLVGNIEIGILLRHTVTVIEQNIKADCHIYVKSTETTPSRIMGTTKKVLRPEQFKLICDELATIPAKTVVTDELEEHYVYLKRALDSNDIAVISSLITSYAANTEATAYLMLGPKKSGNTYSKQDLRILNIITDELLIAIQNALRFEEIQSFNITLQNRIQEATAKLKRSNEKLKEVDEAKDEFISMASHQLRTPLTSVKGYLSMVIEGDAGKISEAQQELLNQAYVSSQRMVYLIADLLNVSRLKTGKFVIDAAPLNLADMVESEIAQLSQAAKLRKLTLTFNKPADFPTLMLDETKTRQVVMNFVDNAIYYTPKGGKIKIELTTDRSSVYFMVKDNGLGVPKAEQPHMFTKFYRATNAQKARPDGTGLGLFMAKKVITDQGGTILFESTEDKGSTFGFKFDKPADSESKD